jgi:hypothetical protein
MLTDFIRLLLFPALMAFAASSDLLTMTISNRLSLALAGGFFLLTIITGMSLTAIGMHLAAAALVLTVSFGFFSMGCQAGGRHGALVRFRLSAGLPDLCVAVWRRADAGPDPVPAPAAAGRARPPDLDSPAA